MKDLVIEILKIVAPISVGLIVFAQGLGIPPKLVGTYFKEQPWLILRSLAASAAGAGSMCVDIHHLRDDLFAVAKKESGSLKSCGFGLVKVGQW